ncbi:reverse transcriptase domain-containing protein [Tanacetum coccineum]
MDHRSKNGLPANERVDSRIAYDGRTIRERKINHLLDSSKIGHQCRPDDGKGREANTYLFRQPSTARSINQLHSNRKASTCSREHDIQYRPRKSVKGQILADFIVERPEDNSKDTLMEDAEELPDPWILFTDGSSCTDGSEARPILTNPEGMEFAYALRFRFDATNNEAKYEALIARLKIAEQMSVENLQANVDS